MFYAVVLIVLFIIIIKYPRTKNAPGARIKTNIPYNVINFTFIFLG